MNLASFPSVSSLYVDVRAYIYYVVVDSIIVRLSSVSRDLSPYWPHNRTTVREVVKHIYVHLDVSLADRIPYCGSILRCRVTKPKKA